MLRSDAASPLRFDTNNANRLCYRSSIPIISHYDTRIAVLITIVTLLATRVTPNSSENARKRVKRKFDQDRQSTIRSKGSGLKVGLDVFSTLNVLGFQQHGTSQSPWY